MRAILSLILGSTAMGIGLRSAWIQAHNHEFGAILDRQQSEIEWYERRITGLRASLQRLAFEARLEDELGQDQAGIGGEIFAGTDAGTWIE